jgi:hypothetical protein
MKKILFWIMLVMLLAGAVHAANGAGRQNVRSLEPARIATPPVLDGLLDD